MQCPVPMKLGQYTCTNFVSPWWMTPWSVRWHTVLIQSIHQSHITGYEINKILRGHRSQGPVTKSPGQSEEQNWASFSLEIIVFFFPLSLSATSELFLWSISNYLWTEATPTFWQKFQSATPSPSGTTKPKFCHVSHRSQGVMKWLD